MLLSRKWGATMGGQLQMDIPYATIMQSDGAPFIIYRNPLYLTHGVNPCLISYYKMIDTKVPSPILLSREVKILKRPNQKKIKKCMKNPKKELKVGDVVLV